jgi:lipopolysaccharide/colanic/teichoic acid biosynthesis glycosyltransferase
MANLTPRRFQHVHEQILLSTPFSLILGWLICVILPFVLFWSFDTLLDPNDGQRTALVATSVAYILSCLSLKKIRKIFPGGHFIGFIAPQTLITYGLVILVTLLFRFEVSRYLLLASGACSLAWLHIEYLITYRHNKLKLAIIPSAGDYTADLTQQNNIICRTLTKLDLEGRRYDGVVADFDNLTPEIERFLTQCALTRIAVYNAKQMYESTTGRVRITRMSENNLGALLPSPLYEKAKFLIDCTVVLATLPLTVPLAIVIAVLIKLENSGSVIYSQIRVGQGNKPFRIYKFRSMRDTQLTCAQFAGEDDPRITKIGRFIRKTRIDEIPQFLNVLKGEMSLIGPRPEQPSFVEEYNQIIPFYSYRHVVKPGITGWAQVRHGYTADANATSIKIEHDFFYIKNCSFSLDVLIVILTVRTILCGFGAR